MSWKPDILLVHSSRRLAYEYAKYIKSGWFSRTNASIKSFAINHKCKLNFQYLQNARIVLVMFDKDVLKDMKEDRYYKSIFNSFDEKILKSGNLTGFVDKGCTRQLVAQELQESLYITSMPVMTSWRLHDYPNDSTEEDLREMYLNKLTEFGCFEIQENTGNPQIIHHRHDKEITPGDTIAVYFGANLLQDVTSVKAVVVALQQDSLESLDVSFTFQRRIPDEDIVMLKVPSDCRLGSGIYRLRFICNEERVLGQDVVFSYMSIEDHLQHVLLQESDQSAAIKLLCRAVSASSLSKSSLEDKLIKMFDEMSPDDLMLFDWSTMVNRMTRYEVKSSEHLPTLLHFAAFYGLDNLCKHLCENYKAASALALCISNMDCYKPAELVDAKTYPFLAQYLGEKRRDLDIYLCIRGNREIYDYVDRNFDKKRQSEEISVPLYISMDNSEAEDLYYVKMKKSDYFDTYGSEIVDLKDAYMSMSKAGGDDDNADDTSEDYEYCEREENFYSNLNTARASVRFADVKELEDTGMRIQSYHIEDNMFYQHDVEINHIQLPTQSPRQKKSFVNMFKRLLTKTKTQKPTEPRPAQRRQRVEVVDDIYYTPISRPEAPCSRESVISNSSTSSGDSLLDGCDAEAPPPIPPRAPR